MHSNGIKKSSKKKKRKNKKGNGDQKITTTHFGLETRIQIDQKWMAHRIGHLENTLLTQQRFNFIARNDIALFQRLDGIILVGAAQLRQYDLAEMSATQNAQQPEVLNGHHAWRRTASADCLRLATRLVSRVAVLQTSRHIATSACAHCRRWRHCSSVELVLILVDGLLLIGGGRWRRCVVLTLGCLWEMRRLRRSLSVDDGCWRLLYNR